MKWKFFSFAPHNCMVVFSLSHTHSVEMSLIFWCCNHFNVKIKLRNHRSRSILNCYGDKFKWNHNHMIYFSIKSHTALHVFCQWNWVLFKICYFSIWYMTWNTILFRFENFHSLNIFWWFYVFFLYIWHFICWLST